MLLGGELLHFFTPGGDWWVFPRGECLHILLQGAPSVGGLASASVLKMALLWSKSHLAVVGPISVLARVVIGTVLGRIPLKNFSGIRIGKQKHCLVWTWSLLQNPGKYSNNCGTISLWRAECKVEEPYLMQMFLQSQTQGATLLLIYLRLWSHSNTLSSNHLVSSFSFCKPT